MKKVDHPNVRFFWAFGPTPCLYSEYVQSNILRILDSDHTIHSFNFPIYRLKQGYVGLGKEKPIVQCNIYGEIFVFIKEYKIIPVNAILQFIYL